MDNKVPQPLLCTDGGIMYSDGTVKTAFTPGPWQVGKRERLVQAGKPETYTVFIVSHTNLDSTKGQIRAKMVCEGGNTRYPNSDGTHKENEANARLIAASPRMFEVLEQVRDSVREPDKWAQNVRFVLQQADGVERKPQSAEERRKDLQVQRAAPELLEALVLALPYVETAELDPTYKTGTVTKVTAQLRAVIAKAEGKL